MRYRKRRSRRRSAPRRKATRTRRSRNVRSMSSLVKPRRQSMSKIAGDRL